MNTNGADNIRSMLNSFNIILERAGDPEDKTIAMTNMVKQDDIPPLPTLKDKEFNVHDIAELVVRLNKMLLALKRLVEIYESALSINGAKKTVLDLSPAIDNLSKSLIDSAKLVKHGQYEDINGLYSAIADKMAKFDSGFEKVRDGINREWKAQRLTKYGTVIKPVYSALSLLTKNLSAFNKKLDIIRQTDFKKQHANIKQSIGMTKP